MNNLKLLKMLETAEERSKHQASHIQLFEDLIEKCSLLESREAESEEKISELEKKLEDEMKAGKAESLEKEQLEKVIIKQQKIMKLALARILPRKSEIQFCQDHVATIRQY